MVAVQVSPANIGIALGRDLTPAEVVQAEQLVADASLLLRAGFGRRGWGWDDADAATVNYVIREVVVARLRQPDPGKTRYEVAIDDGRVATQWQASDGRLTISDDLWQLLAPPSVSMGSDAFTIRPTYQGGW